MWTFGIITAGGKEEYIEQIIGSIMLQNIPNFEILLVGGDAIDGVRHIDFDESIKPGWLTLKKNIIAEEAQYPNICFMHDYIILEQGWYRGIEEFGYNWHTCMHRVLNQDGTRYRDWCAIYNDAWMDPAIDTQRPPGREPGRMLHYGNNTCGRWQYYSGAYFCAKRATMFEVPLNNERLQSQGEDVEWSRRLYQHYGQNAFTMNPMSSVRFLKQKDPVPWQKLELL